MVATIITNAKDVAKLLEELDTKIRAEQGALFKGLGAIFKESAEQRIKTKNEGQWAKASKWILAKRGIQHEILEGAEKFVYARASATGLVVGGDTGKDWTLSQHDEGFVNNPRDEAWKGGHWEIELRDASPLGLPPGTSKFVWGFGNGNLALDEKTPARKIWDSQEEVVAKAEPYAAKWLQALVDGHIK
jgi:hypothetical protein